MNNFNIAYGCLFYFLFVLPFVFFFTLYCFVYLILIICSVRRTRVSSSFGLPEPPHEPSLMAIYIAPLVQLMAPSLFSKPGKETDTQGLYETNTRDLQSA